MPSPNQMIHTELKCPHNTCLNVLTSTQQFHIVSAKNCKIPSVVKAAAAKYSVMERNANGAVMELHNREMDVVKWSSGVHCVIFFCDTVFREIKVVSKNLVAGKC